MQGGNGRYRVLIVENDSGFGPLIAGMLRAGAYEPTLCRSGEAAVQLAAGGEFEVAICALDVPGEEGLELLERLRAAAPETAIVVTSADDDVGIAATATELGVYGYLIKPFDHNQLLITLDGAIHRRELEREAERRNGELREAVAELSLSRHETIARLMRALELRDGDIGAHVERIGVLAETFAGWVGVDPGRARMIGLAARMHDIGKIGVPDRILLKRGPLDSAERRAVERHPEIGREILWGSRTELLRLATTIAATHHEWHDGSGYPAGLSGERIPHEGRLAAIVDVFDALHSDRCYRPALEPAEALAVLRDGRGSQFDPELFDAFMAHYDEGMEIVTGAAADA
jgi:putative two-component system response regulator